MSLPIKLFEPRSTAERMLDRYGYLTKYMPIAAAEVDRLERFKLVIAMTVAGLHLTLSQAKPFNPLLGETIQAHWEDGTQAFLEHTRHHPPITNFLLIGQGFAINGNCEV